MTNVSILADRVYIFQNKDSLEITFMKLSLYIKNGPPFYYKNFISSNAENWKIVTVGQFNKLNLSFVGEL